MGSGRRDSSSDEEERRERRRRKEKKKRREKEKSDNGEEGLDEIASFIKDTEELIKARDEQTKKLEEKILEKRNKRSSSESEEEVVKKKKKKKKDRKKKDEQAPGEKEEEAVEVAEEKDKNPMAMLELEMRARAIKALLLKNDEAESNEVKDEPVEIKEEPIEIDDDSVEERIEEAASKEVETAAETSDEPPENPSHATNSKPETASREEAATEDVTKAGTEEEVEKAAEEEKVEEEESPQRDWVARYDKPIPEGILALCRGGECKLCKVDFNSDLESSSHYQSSRHLAKVSSRLETLFQDRPGEPIGWRLTLAPRLIPQKEEAPRRPVEEETAKVVEVAVAPVYHREWCAQYDRPMTEAILKLCLVSACNLCKISVKSPMMGKQHYEGKVHAKNVNLELDELYLTTGEPRPRRVEPGGQKKKRQKTGHQLAPTLTLEVLEAAKKPPEVDPDHQDFQDQMDQNLILCRNIGKRPKYWS